MNINILDLVNKAKALWTFIKDPANGWYARFRALTDFLVYVLPFLPEATANLFKGGRKGVTTPEQAIARLEALSARKGAVPSEARPTDEEICDCVMTFIVTVTPCCCEAA